MRGKKRVYPVGSVERGICGKCGMEDDLERKPEGWYHPECGGWTTRLQRPRKHLRRIPDAAVADYSTGEYSLRQLSAKYGVSVSALVYRMRRSGLVRQPRARRVQPPRTHCKYGHEFTKENTIMRMKRGRRCRQCRVCQQRYWREYVERQRQAAA